MDAATARQRERDLVEEFAALAPDDPSRAQVREALIVIHQPLVRSLAHRYAGRGEPLDDLIQAGSIGLIQAVDRFDPQRSDSFTSFAVATILGEIRKHFRDHTWSIRVPRRMQEIARQVSTARTELEQELHRSPTVPEIAERVGVDADDVLDALEAAQAYATRSLDAPSIEGGPVHDPGADDDAIAAVLKRLDLAPVLAELDDADRDLLRMRFVEELSQTEIARRLEVDQSQVSRRLAHILLRLRDRMEPPGA
jgi:RNA polymerase sigma-B factor